MCKIELPKPPKVSKEQALKMVDESITQTKNMHVKLRNGSWKASQNVDIVKYRN